MKIEVVISGVDSLALSIRELAAGLQLLANASQGVATIDYPDVRAAIDKETSELRAAAAADSDPDPTIDLAPVRAELVKEKQAAEAAEKKAADKAEKKLTAARAKREADALAYEAERAEVATKLVAEIAAEDRTAAATEILAEVAEAEVLNTEAPTMPLPDKARELVLLVQKTKGRAAAVALLAIFDAERITGVPVDRLPELVAEATKVLGL